MNRPRSTGQFFGPLLSRQPLQGERGATSIEYALIAGVIAIVCVVAFTKLGVVVESFYTVTAALLSAVL